MLTASTNIPHEKLSHFQGKKVCGVENHFFYVYFFKTEGEGSSKKKKLIINLTYYTD
jgi:hypothetical protein